MSWFHFPLLAAQFNCCFVLVLRFFSWSILKLTCLIDIFHLQTSADFSHPPLFGSTLTCTDFPNMRRWGRCNRKLPKIKSDCFFFCFSWIVCLFVCLFKVCTLLNVSSDLKSFTQTSEAASFWARRMNWTESLTWEMAALRRSCLGTLWVTSLCTRLLTGEAHVPCDWMKQCECRYGRM